MSVSHSDCQQTRPLPWPWFCSLSRQGAGRLEGSRDHPQTPQQSPAGGVHGGPDPSLESPDPTQGGKSSVGAAATGTALRQLTRHSRLTAHCKRGQHPRARAWSLVSNKPEGPGASPTTPRGRKMPGTTWPPNCLIPPPQRRSHLQELSSQSRPPSVLFPLFSLEDRAISSETRSR